MLLRCLHGSFIILVISLLHPSHHLFNVSANVHSHDEVNRYQRVITEGIRKGAGGGHFNGNIALGALLSLHHDDEFYRYGIAMREAFVLFLEWVNFHREGVQINGTNMSVSMEMMDDFSEEAFVYKGMNYLLNETSVDFLFAPYSTKLAEISIKAADQVGKLIIASAAANINMTGISDKGLGFGMVPNDVYNLAAAFDFLQSRNATNVAVIGEITLNRCKYDDVITNAEEYNIELISFYELDPASPSYSLQLEEMLTNISASGAQNFIGCSFERLCVEAFPILKERNINLDSYIFSVCSSSDSFVENPLAKNAFALTLWAPSDSVVGRYTGWSAREFDEVYFEHYNVHASYQATATFAAGVILVAAIETTQSLDPVVVAQSMRESYYETVFQNMSFGLITQQGTFKSWIEQIQYTHDVPSREVIYPAQHAVKSDIFPAPSWYANECNENTNYCSGHGNCDSDGICKCESQYYGDGSGGECARYCDGELDMHGDQVICHANRIFYMAGMVDSSDVAHLEYASHMQIIVGALNNGSTFLRDEAKQVHIVLNISATPCGNSHSLQAIEGLQKWALDEHGRSLDAVIGPGCSDGSEAVASYGAQHIITQIDYQASLDDLSNTDKYPYFARVNHNNFVEALVLSTALVDLGIAPYISVISDGNNIYARDLVQDFVDVWEEQGNIVLFDFEIENYDEDTSTVSPYREQYEAVVDLIAVSGTPVVYLVLAKSHVRELMLLVESHTYINRSNIVWIMSDIGVDESHFVENNELYNGMISISSFQPEQDSFPAAEYLYFWQMLDPVLFPDVDEDRTQLSFASYKIMDAILSMAFAFQAVIDAGEEYTDDEFRRFTTLKLTDEVQFHGFTNENIDFNSYGDLKHLKVTLINFQNTSWVKSGTIYYTQETEEVTLDLVYDTIVWPDDTTGVTATYSTQLNQFCPPGQESIESTPDSSSYPVRECMLCNVGYYKTEYGPGLCSLCPKGVNCQDVGITVPCILADYWRQEPPSQEQQGDFNTYAVYSCHDGDICLGGCDLNATCDPTRAHESPICGACAADHYLTAGNVCQPCTSEQMTIALTVALYSLTIVIILFLAIMFFKHKLNQYGNKSKKSDILKTFEEMARKGTVTKKLLLSFAQVMSGSFFSLNINYTNGLETVMHFCNLDIFHAMNSAAECSNRIETGLYLTFDLYLLSPMIVLFVVWIFYLIASYMIRASPLSNDKDFVKFHSDYLLEACWRGILWPCLILYPSLSRSVVNMFKCPDFGSLGSFLESDYSVQCQGEQYNTHFVLALVGVVLYVIGIPVFFYVCIHCREKKGFEGVHLLYKNYAYSFRYYEIVDLVRRLLLTSLVIFVANPSSPSRPLFLFFVDLVALIMLCLFCPYFYQPDDILSVILISVELLSFIFAIIVLSDISDEGNYNEVALYNTLFAILVLAILAVPLTFAFKFQRLNNLFGINLLSKGTTNVDSSGRTTKRRSRLSSIFSPPSWFSGNDDSSNTSNTGSTGNLLNSSGDDEPNRVTRSRSRSRSRYSGNTEHIKTSRRDSSNKNSDDDIPSPIHPPVSSSSLRPHSMRGQQQEKRASKPIIEEDDIELRSTHV